MLELLNCSGIDLDPLETHGRPQGGRLFLKVDMLFVLKPLELLNSLVLLSLSPFMVISVSSEGGLTVKAVETGLLTTQRCQNLPRQDCLFLLSG